MHVSTMCVKCQSAARLRGKNLEIELAKIPGPRLSAARSLAVIVPNNSFVS
jgi:hypothetical protein